MRWQDFLSLLYHIFCVTEIYYAKIFLTERVVQTEKKTTEAAFFVGDDRNMKMRIAFAKQARWVGDLPASQGEVGMRIICIDDMRYKNNLYAVILYCSTVAERFLLKEGDFFVIFRSL